MFKNIDVEEALGNKEIFFIVGSCVCESERERERVANKFFSLLLIKEGERQEHRRGRGWALLSSLTKFELCFGVVNSKL